MRVDVVHNHGTNFLIGRTVGTVFNPVVGGPDRVVSLESSAKTNYDALLVEMERRYAGRFGVRASYTLSKAMNYANDDQIPFGNGPLDPNNLAREYGPAPNDQRHRLVVSGVVGPWREISARRGVEDRVGRADGHPDAGRAVPRAAAVAQCRRPRVHVGGRAERLHSRGERRGRRRLVSRCRWCPTARASTTASTRWTSGCRARSRSGRSRVEAVAEVFNLFNSVNILGTSTVNYSGFANVLVRDSNDPASPGYLHSSRFGTPVTTAGGVFGSGGPRALQLAARVTF